MGKLFPFLSALDRYTSQNLKGDVSAGLTVGVMLIPQGMAYAMIAGLPPVYGLYAGIFPALIYSLFGTSRQLAVGPAAMDSLLVATAIVGLAVIGTDNYIAMALLLALIVGAIQFAMGVLRLGFLVNFISMPVINGFIYAVALTIGVSQLSTVFGIEAVRSKFIWTNLVAFVSSIETMNFYTLLLGLGAVLMLLLTKKWVPKVPGSLLVLVLGILITYFARMDHLGVQIVGAIPEGLPSFNIPSLDISIFRELLPIAFTLAMVGFIEAYSIGKTIQRNHQKEYEVKPNRELIGLGLGNIVGSFFGAFPTTGGLSRSAVNEKAGANSIVSTLISVLLVLMTLIFLTPLFYYLPKTALAAIILVAVLGLIDFKKVKALWKTDRHDFFMLTATFVGTLVFGIEKGVIIGVLLSLFMLVYKTSEPHMALLGKVEGTTHFRNLMRYQTAVDYPEIAILRFDARLYFANINALKEKVDQVVKSKPKLKTFILDAQSISDIDSTGMSGLTDITVMLHDLEVEFKMVSIIGPVRDKLVLAGFIDLIGVNNFYPCIADAMNDLHESAMDFQSNC